MKLNWIRLVAAIVVASAALSGSAKAASAWVTPGGTGDCSSPSSPCSSIANASQFAGQDGEIFCLAPGQVGSAALTVGVTIDCPGGSVTNLTINATNQIVKIRGLEINPAGCTIVGCTTGGLAIQAASSVTLDSVVVLGTRATNVPGFATPPGISDKRAGPAKLIIRNSVISDNAGIGILIVPQGGVITIALDNVAVWNNTYGIAVGSGGRVMIDRSTFSGNSVAGVEADGGAFIGLNNTLVSSNNIGIQAGGTIAISNSDIDSNNTAISGVTQSSGNNRLFANISDGATPTVVGQH